MNCYVSLTEMFLFCSMLIYLPRTLKNKLEKNLEDNKKQKKSAH